MTMSTDQTIHNIQPIRVVLAYQSDLVTNYRAKEYIKTK